jgi:hypothetical protein
MGLNVQDLPEIIGISRRTLFECRSAESAVSGKTLAKLEAAEARAVEKRPEAKLAESSANPKDISVGESTHPAYDEPCVMRDDVAVYGARRKTTAEMSIEERLARAESLLAAMAGQFEALAATIRRHL